MAKHKAYPEYKDSGVEWLGEIPLNWSYIPHKYLAVYYKGRNPTTLSSEPKRDCVPYLSMSYLRTNIVEHYTLVTSDARVVPDDLVLIIWDGSNAGEFIKSKRGILSSTMAVANVTSKLNHQYYWFSCNCIEPEIRRHATGMGIPHVNGDHLRYIAMPSPSIEEQIKISLFLIHETMKIDLLVEKQQQLIELLKEKRQALISHAVTKGLNPDVPMKDSGVEWLGNVPEHWLVCPIKHILNIPITDGPHETPDFFDEGIPFISAEAISTGKIDFDKKRAYISKKDHNRYCEKYAPKINDIYMVKSGATTGVTALVETDEVFNIWSPLAAFRCKDNYIPNYVLNFFRTAEYLNILALSWTFGTQQNIGMGILKNIHITCPPIDEAKEIAAHLHNHCLKLEEMLTLALKQVTLLKERRTALISAAVTGKIDLRNWTPPASSAEAVLTAEEATA
ncbi:restriction endonuclease subunit S [Enterobacter asburiae]|uniref:restriction endonuclease subunit S n=1 Tax=Enterobacter asburiae TaxID=61645 RepID=UPI002647D015|nr:restriction endonuclease subunit S [Enterobacter asburiae]WKE04182.1 restriction endonuclease subunit S [Enterobacter asburiae]WKE09984.1 restriction endonuclease subunit S [Enterobacter asburiae]